MRRLTPQHPVGGLLGALLAASLVLGAGLAVLWFSWWSLGRAESEADLAQSAAQHARLDFERIEREAPTLRLALARLAALHASGLIGPPARLDWAEQLRVVARRHGLAPLNFEIEPPRKLGSLDQGERYVVHATRMHLEGSLLHEGVLLRLLDDLSGPVRGQLHPARCVLERASEDAPLPARLQLQCDLDWFSIDPPGQETAP